MNPFVKKIPRGVIYHKITESIGYLLQSLFMPLDRQDEINRFEEAFAKYCERDYCVAFPFARTAMYFALKNLDLPKGSEIIMPPITIKGIVDVVVELGLVPVYVEMDADTINFQMDDLRKKIGPNTKAVILTTLFGLVPDVAAMLALFREHGIFVIEDFSQCLNGRFDGKRVGTFGDIGIYSSSSIKTLDTLGGGLAVTSNPAIHEGLRRAQAGLAPADRKALVKKAWTNLVRNVATSKLVFSLLTFPFLQLIRMLSPESALKQTGHRDKSRLSKLPRIWFCKYSSIQAKIGLAHIDSVLADDKARVSNVEFLRANCGTARFPATTAMSGNVYWQLILLVPNAVEAQAFFARRGIDSATSSLELVCDLKEYPNRVALPVAERVYRNGIFIPCFPDLSRADMERIAETTREYFRSHANGQ
jgi:perosamine synthetase